MRASVYTSPLQSSYACVCNEKNVEEGVEDLTYTCYLPCPVFPTFCHSVICRSCHIFITCLLQLLVSWSLPPITEQTDRVTLLWASPSDEEEKAIWRLSGSFAPTLYKYRNHVPWPRHVISYSSPHLLQWEHSNQFAYCSVCTIHTYLGGH